MAKRQPNKFSPAQKLEQWGAGPWVTEPDEVMFESSGLTCWMRRHPNLGSWCGYVGVPRSHPLHGLHYDDALLDGIESPHGGLTFSDDWLDSEADLWWFGFDCGHSGDRSPGLEAMIRRVRDPEFAEFEAHEEESGVHRRWRETYRDLNYVYGECERLAEQLRAAAELGVNSWTFCRGCKSTKALRLCELKQGPTYLCGRCWRALKKEVQGRYLRSFYKSAAAKRIYRRTAHTPDN